MFQEHPKHKDIDCHHVRDQLKAGAIKPSYAHTSQQPADLFTKVVPVATHQQLLSKWGVFNLFQTPASGGVLMIEVILVNSYL